ncbi:MAG: ACT domain-containing protein [Clostridia bacterium]|nr:ACT domain-containing protein [Clostridia bacterium]MBR0409259.1 ACT domain-containing protein [Clostridia bacterium]
MKLELLPMAFTVCQLTRAEEADLSVPFTFFARTDEEISLVCPIASCPADALNRQDGWRCLRVTGVLDFSLVGILSRIAGCLAEAKVPIFAVSTYNTDYLLFREAFMDTALDALKKAGYEIKYP